MTPADISVVIPAINEQEGLPRAIDSAFQAGASEVIVSNGGSRDRTHEVAIEAGATKVVRSLPGRGIQMNSGALLAEREFILFLHADNQLGSDCLTQICEHDGVTWGAFRQRIDSPSSIFRAIEWGNAKRVQWRRMPFGDQAMFVRSSTFKELGGFAEIPLMEDVEIAKRIRKIARPILLSGPVNVSARRWNQQGVVRQTLRNWSLQLAYYWGAKPEKLKQRYR